MTYRIVNYTLLPYIGMTPITELFSLTSPEIDRHYGLEVDATEKSLYLMARDLRPEGNLANLGHVLHNGHQTWVGLDPQTLLTPYSELVQICELLAPQSGESMIDLGAGYGRLGLVLSELDLDVAFSGYELVSERVSEGNRVFENLGIKKSKLYCQDLTLESFAVPYANYYFLYDYGKVSHIRQTLKQLEELARYHRFKVIARGNGSRSIIDYEHTWLSQIYPAHHEKNFSIYSMSL